MAQSDDELYAEADELFDELDEVIYSNFNFIEMYCHSNTNSEQTM